MSSSSSNIGSTKLEKYTLILKNDKTTIKNVNSLFANGQTPVTTQTFLTTEGCGAKFLVMIWIQPHIYRARITIWFILIGCCFSNKL